MCFEPLLKSRDGNKDELPLLRADLQVKEACNIGLVCAGLDWVEEKAL